MINHFDLDYLRKVEQMSLSPYTKVGCVLMDGHYSYVANGWNNCIREPYPGFWDDREKCRDFMVHAEIHALSRIREGVSADVCLITLLPCVHCMNALAVNGIKEVHYFRELERDKRSHEVAEFHNIQLFKINE